MIALDRPMEGDRASSIADQCVSSSQRSIDDNGWKVIHRYFHNNDTTFDCIQENSSTSISPLLISEGLVDIGIDLLTVRTCRDQKHFFLARLQPGCRRLVDELATYVDEYDEVVAVDAFFLRGKEHAAVLQAFNNIKVGKMFWILFRHASQELGNLTNYIVEQTIQLDENCINGMDDDCVDGRYESVDGPITITHKLPEPSCYAASCYKRGRLDLADGTPLYYAYTTAERLWSDYPDTERREIQITPDGVKLTRETSEENEVLAVHYTHAHKNRLWTFFCDREKKNVLAPISDRVSSVPMTHAFHFHDVNHLNELPASAWIEMDYESRFYSLRQAFDVDKYVCLDKAGENLVVQTRRKVELTETSNSPAYFRRGVCK